MRLISETLIGDNRLVSQSDNTIKSTCALSPNSALPDITIDVARV